MKRTQNYQDMCSKTVLICDVAATTAHAGVAAAMNLREAWISAASFVDSYEYMIVKVHLGVSDCEASTQS
jgi:hypothetical protein